MSAETDDKIKFKDKMVQAKPSSHPDPRMSLVLGDMWQETNPQTFPILTEREWRLEKSKWYK